MGKVIMSGIVPQLVDPEPPGIKASELAVGSSVYLMENGVPVEYLVVNQGIPGGSSLYDDSCDGLWLLRKDIYSERSWGSGGNYNESTIHTYLNNTFFNLFGADTKNIIKTVKIPYYLVSDDAPTSGSDGLPTSVFLLGAYEVGLTGSTYTPTPEDGACLEYFDGTDSTDSRRIANYSGKASNWWLRSNSTTSSPWVAQVSATGGKNGANGSANTAGVRPALILPNTALFDEETLELKINATVKNVSVSVTDAYGGVSALLASKGALTVGGVAVSTTAADITTVGSTVTIAYKLTGDIGAARNVTVNGTSIGSVNYAGDSVFTTITVSDGDTITVAFT